MAEPTKENPFKKTKNFRLFVALQIQEPEVLKKLYRLLQSLRQNFPSISWVRETNLHITLKFIGETPKERIQNIIQALENIQVPPFELIIEGLGGFPTLKNAKTLWIGIQKHEKLLSLQRQIEERLRIEKKLIKEKLSQKESRPFHPHITLARLRKPMPRSLLQFLEERKNRYLASTQSKDFHLMQTQIKNPMIPLSQKSQIKKIHYKKLYSFPLIFSSHSLI